MAVFIDIGRVGSDLDGLFGSGPRVSGGLVLRAAHDTVRVFDLSLGVSKEGVELGLTFGGL